MVFYTSEDGFLVVLWEYLIDFSHGPWMMKYMYFVQVTLASSVQLPLIEKKN